MDSVALSIVMSHRPRLSMLISPVTLTWKCGSMKDDMTTAKGDVAAVKEDVSATIISFKNTHLILFLFITYKASKIWELILLSSDRYLPRLLLWLLFRFLARFLLRESVQTSILMSGASHLTDQISFVLCICILLKLI